MQRKRHGADFKAKVALEAISGDGLVQPLCTVLAVIEYDGRAFLLGGPGGGATGQSACDL